MPCISGTLFPLLLYLELMSCLCNPTYLAKQQTAQCTQIYFNSEMRATDLEDSKSWKSAEDYWLKLQVEKDWAHCLKAEDSTRKHQMQVKSKGFPRTDNNTRKHRGWYCEDSSWSFSWLLTKHCVGWCTETTTQKQDSTAHSKGPFLWQSPRHYITKITNKSHL